MAEVPFTVMLTVEGDITTRVVGVDGVYVVAV